MNLFVKQHINKLHLAKEKIIRDAIADYINVTFTVFLLKLSTCLGRDINTYTSSAKVFSEYYFVSALVNT